MDSTKMKTEPEVRTLKSVVLSDSEAVEKEASPLDTKPLENSPDLIVDIKDFCGCTPSSSKTKIN